MENYITLPALDNISPQGVGWMSESMPSFDFSTFVDSITSGENVFKADAILSGLVKTFMREIYVAIEILAVIVSIALISAVLNNLRTNLTDDTTYNSGMVCIFLITGLAVEIFRNSCEMASIVTRDITNVMWAVLPVMMSLVSGSGYTSTGVITHPVLLLMCNVFAEILEKILIPLTVTYLAISLIDLMSETVELGKLRELLKKTYNFILGLIMTLFTGLLGISTLAGTSLDSVGAKGVKFALSNMVPFVGRSISDAMGAVVSASGVLKNAVGITSVVCMLSLCAVPILKTAATVLCIRIGAAVCEPIAEKKTVQILTCIGDSISMINAAVISTVVMMIIALSIIMGVKG